MMLFFVLIGIPLVLGLFAQFKVKSAFGKWKKVRASSGVTGAEAAREILKAAQISDVDVVEINGMLGDHYDPTKKRLCLSSDVYRTPSVAALGISAHECGHAIQHSKAYAPLKWRMAVVPMTSIASRVLPFVLIGGMFIPMFFREAIIIAAVCYGALALFQMITLPVEFDASRRAKLILGQMQLIQPGEETKGVNNVLDSAALTYVAAFVAVLGQLAYYLLILSGNRR